MTNGLIWAMGILAALSLAAAVAAWVSRIRWARDHEISAQRTLEAKNHHIATLEQQIAMLRETDSVRMAERYITTKKGLEARIARLESELSQARARRGDIQRKLDDLTLDRETRAAEVARLRSDLLKAQQDAQRLEQIVQAVYAVGPISIEEVKREMAVRRRLSAHIKGRLEHLGMEGEARIAEVERLKREAEQCRQEAARLSREIEITRSAAAILDGMLGIDSDVRDKLSRYLSDRLDDSIRRLAGTQGRDPLGEIVHLVDRGAREKRLLEPGSADGARPREDVLHPAEPAPLEPAAESSDGDGAHANGLDGVAPPPPGMATLSHDGHFSERPARA